MLEPGDEIVVDQFEVVKHGQKLQTGGKKHETDKFSVDVAAGYSHLYFQVSLGASEAMCTKHAFKHYALSYGVSLRAYETNNGICTKEEFIKETKDNEQSIVVSGVDAHHQNGIAKHGIQTVITYDASCFPALAGPELYRSVANLFCTIQSHISMKDWLLMKVLSFPEVKGSFPVPTGMEMSYVCVLQPTLTR